MLTAKVRLPAKGKKAFQVWPAQPRPSTFPWAGTTVTTASEEHGCVPVELYLQTLKREFHVMFTHHGLLLTL